MSFQKILDKYRKISSPPSGISILQPEMYELLSLLCSKFGLSSLDGDVLKLEQGIVVPDGERFRGRLWELIEQVELLQLPNQKDGVFSKNGIDIEWADIPAGTFMMGSPENEVDRFGDEGPQPQVRLSGFKMSKYAVTFAQYDAFCEATGRSKPSDEGWGRGNRPVINVDWDDATAFAEWMGCRLPTEAEWEYACRAGTSTPFNTGDCLSTAQANYDGNYPYSNCIKGSYLERTQPVGSYAPNAWGLYDMHGNVWEWCSDWYWYGEYSSASQTNPTGAPFGVNRILRGGSWRNFGGNCRSARRNNGAPSLGYNHLGFRLVVPS
jgi:formylglycine-generating enzyme required for sulfatase activity